MIVFACAFALGVLSSAALWIALADWTEPARDLDRAKPVQDYHPAIVSQIAQRFGGIAQ